LKSTKNPFLSIAAALSIVACDSGEPTLVDNRVNGADNLMSLVGLIKMEPNSLEADFSRGVFGQLTTAMTAQLIESSFAPTTDVCDVSRYKISHRDLYGKYRCFHE